MVEHRTLFPTRSQRRCPCYCKPVHHQTVESTERSQLVVLLPRRGCLLCCTRRFPPVLACRVERWRRQHGRGWAAELVSMTALSLVASRVEAGEWTGVKRRLRTVLRFRTSPPALVFLVLPSSWNKRMVHLLLFLGCRARRCRHRVLRSQSLGNPDERERQDSPSETRGDNDLPS